MRFQALVRGTLLQAITVLTLAIEAPGAFTMKSQADGGPLRDVGTCGIALGSNDPCDPNHQGYGFETMPTLRVPEINAVVAGSTVEFRFIEPDMSHRQPDGTPEPDNFCFELSDSPSFIASSTIKLRCRLDESHHPNGEDGNPNNDTVRLFVAGFPNDGTRYCWRMKNRNSYLTSGASWCFQNGTTPKPGTPRPIAPRGTLDQEDDTRVLFSWGKSRQEDSVDYYVLELNAVRSDGTYEAAGPEIQDCGPGQFHLSANGQNSQGHTCSGFPGEGRRYAWRVRACNSSCSEFSAWTEFVNGPERHVPGRPVLEMPMDEQTIVTFTWIARPESEEVVRYEYWITAVDGGAPAGCSRSTQSTATTGFSCGDFEDDGREFVWNVKACNAVGCGETATATFRNGPSGPPPRPRILKPSDGEGPGSTVEFEWTEPDPHRGTDRYRLLVRCCETSECPESEEQWTVKCDESDLTGLRYSCAGFRNLGDPCQVEVSAHNAVDWGQARRRRFYNGDRPDRPRLLAPAHQEDVDTTSITFSWAAATGASSYRLSVRASGGGTLCSATVPTAGAGLSQYSHQCSGFPRDGTRARWSVTAVGANALENTSDAWLLRSVPPRPSKPHAYFKTNGPVIEFYWGAVAGANGLAVTYEASVERLTPSGQSQLVWGPLTTQTPITWTGPASYDGSLYVGRVRATLLNGDVTSDQAFEQFRDWPTGPPQPPTLLAPEQGEVVAGPSVNLTWEAGARAQYHRVSVHRSAGGSHPGTCGGIAKVQANGFAGNLTHRCDQLPDDGSQLVWVVAACNDFNGDGTPDCAEAAAGFTSGTDLRDGGARMDDGGSVPSDVAPPATNDRTFVAGANIPPSQCAYASDVEAIRFEIPVTRVVTTPGNQNPDGTLKDPGRLIEGMVVSEFASLVIQAYDVDSIGEQKPSRAPERDIVLFNGFEVGELDGENGLWRETRPIDVPIEYVRFPRRDPGARGAIPNPAINVVEILPDADHPAGSQIWCVGVDWAALSFRALSPVVLVHGNNQTPAFWVNRGFTTGLSEWGIAYDTSIDMPTDSVAAHAIELAGGPTSRFANLEAIARSLGVDSLHVIAHSKGGLDVREYMAIWYSKSAALRPFSILSLTTLSTPHEGSFLADLTVSSDALLLLDAGLRNAVGLLGALFPPDDGHFDLTTYATRDFNAENIPALPRDTSYAVVGADADRNDNGSLDLDEAIELFADGGASAAGARLTHWLLRKGKSYEVRTTRLPDGTTRFVDWNLRWGGGPNDALVTTDSATLTESRAENGTIGIPLQQLPILEGTEGRNHSSIANADVARWDDLRHVLEVAEVRRGDWR